MATLGITPRQHALLTFLAAQPVCPTFPKMAEAIGSSKGGIHSMLGRLEQAGYIRRIPHRVRAIEVLQQPSGQPPASQAERLARARAWRIAMKPYFDEIYGAPIRAATQSYPFRHRTCAEWVEADSAIAQAGRGSCSDRTSSHVRGRC